MRLYAPGNRMLGFNTDPTDEIGLDVDVSYKFHAEELCSFCSTLLWISSCSMPCYSTAALTQILAF